MFITAACCIHPRGKAFDGQWACWSDDFLPSLELAAKTVQEAGSLAVLQIHHGGRSCPSRLCGGEPLSASAIPHDRPNAETPRAMTDEEIEEAISAYGSAARRAVEAGYEGVEIHGANTYLLQQFVSPHSNRREDKWGQNRLLFSQRVVEEVLNKVKGRAFVGYRFSPEELEEPGIRWEDTAALIELLSDSELDYLHVSLWEKGMRGLKGDWDEPTLAKVSRQIAQRKPLMGVGQVASREDAEECLKMGADMVAVGRAALTQPDLPRLMEQGRPARMTIPREGSGTLFNWPKGIEERALNAGWFEFED